MKKKSNQNVTLHIGLMMTGQSLFMNLAEARARQIIVRAYTSHGLSSSKKDIKYFDFCRGIGAPNFVLLINGKHATLCCANNDGVLFTLDEARVASKDLLEAPSVRKQLGVSA